MNDNPKPTSGLLSVWRFAIAERGILEQDIFEPRCDFDVGDIPNTLAPVEVLSIYALAFAKRIWQNDESFVQDDTEIPIERWPVPSSSAAASLGALLKVVASHYPQSELGMLIVDELAKMIKNGAKDIAKVTEVMVLEHLDLNNSGSPLRPFFAHWWTESDLASALQRSLVLRW